MLRQVMRVSLILPLLPLVVGCPVSGGRTGSAPSAPTGLRAAGDKEAILLGWTDDSPDRDGFMIERKAGRGGTWVLLTHVGPDWHTYEDSTVTPGIAYDYRVCAYNATGASGYSNETGGMALEAPALLSPYTSQVVRARVKLRWTAVNGAEAYLIDLWSDEPGTNRLLDDQAATATRYTITTPLTAGGVTYFWRVRAASLKPGGISDYSRVFSFTVKPERRPPRRHVGARRVHLR